jgi:FkbM family methyltransferase
MAWIFGSRRARQRLAREAGPLSGGQPATADGPRIPLPRSHDLIIDVGAHRGCDTDFYLQKGFRVVAVEANPLLAGEIGDKFRAFVDAGRLVVLPYGIHQEGGEFTFYRNLDKDDWSSFKFEIGARDNTRYEAIPVRCIPFEEVLRRFGIPYYLKIDIEGHDGHVLDALLRLRAVPKYLSVESHSLDYLARLRVLGYDRFKIVNQNKNWQVKCPYPPREGKYVDFEFGGHSSGPFGEESPGEWRTFEEVAYDYLHMWFGFNDRHNVGEGWWDFHATRAGAA